MSLNLVRTCPECQISKPRNQPVYGTIMPLQIPEAPWQDISMDLIVNLPRSQTYDSIFVVVDRFSKMAHFIPTRVQATAPDLAQLFFDNIVRLHGFPRSIVSDRDPRFLSHFWRELFALTETTLRFSTANHPQTDGQTERTNRTLEQYLKLHVRHNPARWAQYLTTAEIAYNNLTHSAIGTSPFYLVYQRHANFPLDFSFSDLDSKNAAVESLLSSRQAVLAHARDSLDSARQRMIRMSKDKVNPPPFKLDDLVLVHKGAFRRHSVLPDLNKFDDRWYGPYKIVKVVNENAYQLELPKSFRHHNVINITFLRIYRISVKFPRPHPDAFFLPPVGPDTVVSDSASPEKSKNDNDDDGDKEYEAESILACRLTRQRRGRPKKQTLAQQLQISMDPHDYEFLIKWKGYPLHDATWEPYSNLTKSHDFVTVYLDDILVYSESENEHLTHVDAVLDRLREHKWYCKLKKCDFAATSVEYLGHIVSNGHIAIDPDKMKAVRDWPIPFRNVTEVQSFLGLIGYYRKFIPHFSHIARPLHDLTRKNAEFKWIDSHTNAVAKLKKAIAAPDCLAIFDSEFTTILTTDACDYALGAALSQKHPQGERPVAFISRILTLTECRYSMWEKELFSIIWAVKYFRPYLLNHKFTIKSDNKPATQMIANSSMKLSTSATNRVIRWILSLQTYDFTIEHQPGTSNVVADALSRFPLHLNVIPDDQPTADFCQLKTTPITERYLHNKFVQTYEIDPPTKLIYDQLKDGQFHPRLTLSDGLIVTRETPFRILLPDNAVLRIALLQEIHNSPLTGHPGFHKFLSYVSRLFVGPNLRHDVLEFVRTCPECQISKPRNQPVYGTIMPLQIPEAPWQDISMDLIVNLPRSQTYDSIFVVVDRFSKMAHFIPTRVQATAPDLAQLFFDNIVRLHGFPRSIVSDRDPRFLSHFWRELFALTETTLRFSTANHPQTDGQTERTNRTLEQYLKLHVRHNPARWAQYLTTAEIAYNNLTHSAIGTSPFYLVYQRHANFPLDFSFSDLDSKNAAVESLLSSRQAVLAHARDSLDSARQRMIRMSKDKVNPPPFQT